ncbi:phage late control D family protein [Rhizobium tumorigenes]|uniref:phage late control D family protein n=1 Tax=Rhizobium tumorigenes TaxID=2041385 RepID=UPI00242018BA|nr:contractile injection system protein, VgrG/Pvc8 family [Rhizobium tumorigenes]WFS02760.1 contractile injection system protein, VgrG/Pvc8 family [Rhizobium tumorigenes]
MTTPRVRVSIDGQAVAGAFYERLVSITVTDKTGVNSDTVDIELNDGSPQFLAIPRKGAIIDVKIGYGSVRSLGQFTVDKVTTKCLPYSMSISGKSANLRSGKLKERQERHWDKAKLKDVIGQIATESGLTAAVDPDIGEFEYDWLGQQDESNVHFLRRLEQKHNGMFAIKGGKLIFSKQGSGQSASGSFVGSVVVTPDIIVEGSCSFEVNDRTKYKKVVAYYQDKDKAKRVEIEAEGDSDGDSVYRIPESHASVEEADKAAQAKSKSLKRGEGSASVTVVGDTGITAGAPLLFSGVRPGLDGVPYVIESATHHYSKAGYTTAITSKLYDGKSGAGGKKAAGDAANDNKDAGKVAPNSAPGTPPTPGTWDKFKRNGSTDAN